MHADPSLVRLTPSVVTKVEAFLVIPRDHRNTVRVRLVMDRVIALFERERALLGGCVKKKKRLSPSYLKVVS